MEFLSKDNLRLCNRVFRKYMRGHLGIEVHDDPELRRMLFGSMQTVMTRYGRDPNKSVRDLNNIMLANSRDLYVAAKTPRAAAIKKDGTGAGAGAKAGAKAGAGGRARDRSVIDRDRKVFGDREVTTPGPYDRPVDSTAIDDDDEDDEDDDTRKKRAPRRQRQQEDDVERALALMLSSRGDDAGVKPFVEDDTQQHLRRIMRDEAAAAASAQPPAEEEDEDEDAVEVVSGEGGGEGEDLVVEEEDANANANANDDTADDAVEVVVDDEEGGAAEDEVLPVRGGGPSRADTLIGPHRLVETVTYLSLNGFDRNWTQDPYRYRFTAKTASGAMRTSFRDVTFLQATMLVIPMEAPAGLRDTRTTFLRNRTVFQHDFSFSLPYVLLCVDGIDDVYDGTNDTVRTAFCKFVYSKHYRANDTRGFVVLQPMQDEIKWFLPTPLASLPNLTLSVRRPNGTLMNESRDDYGVNRVDFSEVNDTVLGVELSKYFDVNEFTKGDHVNIRVDFEVPPLGDTATDAEVNTRRQFEYGLRMMSEYLNRGEGHEILEVGNMNEAGLMRNFHIFAPGKLDQRAGEVTLDTEAIDALNKFNDEGFTLKGHIMNASLQTSVSLKVGMRIADAQHAFGHRTIGHR